MSKKRKKEDKLSKAFNKYFERLKDFQGIDVEKRIAKINDAIEKKEKRIEDLQQRIQESQGNLALKKWLDNIRKEIDILKKARKKLKNPGTVDALNEMLLAYKKETLENLRKLEDADFSKLSFIAQKISRAAHEQYPFYDQIYDTGLNFVFKKDDPEKRAVNMALVPRNISRSKWIFLVALTAHDCKIDLTPKEITLIGRMYNRLADHERGADNDTMPAEYKLRHNPAIHSLHTCTLIDSILTEAQEKLAQRPQGISKKECDAFSQIRQKLMLMALLHDMGEIEGEISQGMDKQRLSTIEAERFEHDRNSLEEDIFVNNMQGRLKEMKDISKDTAKDIEDKFKKHFDETEKTGTFIGRLFKTCERMQSQHDYLRFNPKGHKSVKLADTHTGNKVWSLSYVSFALRDAASTRHEGRNSLKNLAAKEDDPHLQAIYTAILEGINAEYSDLQKRLHEAFQIKRREPRTP